jgi:hypothetical protein
MSEITDEYIKEMLLKANDYTVVILKKTEKFHDPGTDKIKYEHGKRNFQLRKEGILSIVCRINDSSSTSGVGIFNTDLEDVKRIMDEDPGVLYGIFTYEVHRCSSFPGDKLP